jgi:4-alpha-glucanotransferase
VRSVATTGTHDTEPLVTWWASAPEGERLAALSLPLVRQRLGDRVDAAVAAATLTEDVRDALIEVVVASAAEFVILPVQDVFGWPDRNQHAGHRGRCQLDVAATVAGRVDRRAARRRPCDGAAPIAGRRHGR